jgi:hypothetical protein
MLGGKAGVFIGVWRLASAVCPSRAAVLWLWPVALWVVLLWPAGRQGEFS